MLDDACILYIDGGTTRTRAWAVTGDRVIAAERVSVGARDTAREGSPRRLIDALHHVVRKLGERCRAQGQPAPALGVAAGMITSPEGLVEVPHVVAPAGAAALAGGAVCRVQTEVAALPIVYVPGVRSGPEKADRETIPGCDVMRGEEVLGLGLAQRGHLAGGGVALSLGSHWKAVRVDIRERVTRSVSTLSGELIHAVRSQTILASAVPGDWPPHLPGDWVEAGLRRARADGLPRALYCVRLLDQRAASTPLERLAFLVGATIGADVATLLPAPTDDSRRVVLVGAPALVEAWEAVARGRGLEPVTLSEEDREAAFRAGCLAVLAQGRVERGAGPGVSWKPPSAP